VGRFCENLDRPLFVRRTYAFLRAFHVVQKPKNPKTPGLQGFKVKTISYFAERKGLLAAWQTRELLPMVVGSNPLPGFISAQKAKRAT